MERRLQRDGLAEVHAGPAHQYLEGVSAGASFPEPPPAEPLRALWEAREAYLDRLRDLRDWEIIDCRLRGFTVAVTAERLEISPDQVERRMTDLRQEAERFVEARLAVKRRIVLQPQPGPATAFPRRDAGARGPPTCSETSARSLVLLRTDGGSWWLWPRWI